MKNAIEQNGLAICRTPKGVGIGWTEYPPPIQDRPLFVEVLLPEGKLPLTVSFLHPLNDMPWRDYYGRNVDHLTLGIRVKDGDKVLAELPTDDLLPFMKLRKEQVHVTENYVSVPPALTITDEVGAVWTLGFTTAPPEQSPHGEFAFNVLRDGADVGEIASRIERRSGKIRVFTRHGWKQWTGTSFF